MTEPTTSVANVYFLAIKRTLHKGGAVAYKVWDSMTVEGDDYRTGAAYALGCQGERISFIYDLVVNIIRAVYEWNTSDHALARGMRGGLVGTDLVCSAHDDDLPNFDVVVGIFPSRCADNHNILLHVGA